jgi:hypothetical protein
MRKASVALLACALAGTSLAWSSGPVSAQDMSFDLDET